MGARSYHTIVAALVAVTGCVSENAAAPETRGRIVVEPSFAAVFDGDSVQFQARITDQAGAPLNGEAVRWSSSASGVVEVDPAGRARARGPGVAWILASFGKKTSLARVQVNPSVSTNVLVNGPTAFRYQEEPHLALGAGGELYVGWKEMDQPGGVNRVAFARSGDGGVTWSEPDFMAPFDPLERQSDPWLVPTGPAALCFGRWGSSDGARTGRIVVSCSADEGGSWSDPQDVHQSASINGLADKESLASDGAGTLYLAYHVSGQTTPVVASRSTDAGRTWSPPQLVTPNSGQNIGPVLAARPGGLVYVAWLSQPGPDIQAASSRDGGITWSPPSRVNPVSGSVFNGRPSTRPALPTITSDPSGAVLVAWVDYVNGDLEVVASRSDDGGTSWSRPARMSDVSLGEQWMPVITSGSDGTIHAAWYDGRTGNTNLVYARSQDGGRTWSTNLRVSTRETRGLGARLGDYFGLTTGTDNDTYVVWTDWRGTDPDIYFAPLTYPQALSGK